MIFEVDRNSRKSESPVQRNRARYGCIGHSGDGARLIYKIVIERYTRRAVLTKGLVRMNPDGQDPLGAKTGIDLRKHIQSLDEKPGGDDQHRRERDLGTDQPAPKVSPGAFRGALA